MKKYEFDPEEFSMELFRELLRNKEILPGRRILKEDIDVRFEILLENGINNLADLNVKLKSKEKIAIFSAETGLEEDYLTILKREANSYIPKPVKIKEMDGISFNTIEKLISAGINTSKQIYENLADPGERKELSDELGIPLPELNKIFCLSDLCRVFGIGPTTVHIFYDAGIKSVEQIKNSIPEDLMGGFLASNEQNEITRMHAPLGYFRYIIEMSRILP